MRAGLFSGDALADPTSMRAAVLDSPGMAGADLAGAVSTGAPYTVAATGTTPLRGSRRSTSGSRPTRRGCSPSAGIETRVLPSSASIDELLDGWARRRLPLQRPGRPGRRRRTPSPSPRRCCAARCRCSASASATRSSPAPWASGRTRCATATAGSTSRSSTTPTARWRSQPEPRLRGRRHSRASASTRRSAGAPVSHSCPNDGTVEGLTCEGVPAFSVQYHPEAAAGPHDAADLFDRFADLMGESLMPRREDIHHVLVIGSGPIVIGQAAEFDYSGTQACRVLREEGLRVSLVNSNPATIMTDPEIADATYVEPITVEYLTKVIEVERPDALLATLGGQTALNAAIALHDAGVLERFGVELIGADIDAIQRGEDRLKFKDIVRADRRRRPPQRGLPLDGRGPGHRRRGRAPGGHPAELHDGRARLGPRLHPRRARAPRRRGPGGEPGARGAHRGVGARVEGVRARAHARRQGQRRRRVLDRERRPDGRAHRRLGDRRARDDADRPRVPAHARHRHRGAARGRRRDRRLQHPVRGAPDHGPSRRHRDEPARLALERAGLEGHRLPDRQDRRPPGRRLHPRRDHQRHHRRDPGELRADAGLRRGQGAAVRVREVPRRRPDADHDDEVGRRGDGAGPQLPGGAQQGAAVGGDQGRRVLDAAGSRRGRGGSPAPGVAAARRAALRRRARAAARGERRAGHRGLGHRRVVRRADRGPRRAARRDRRRAGARRGAAAPGQARRALRRPGRGRAPGARRGGRACARCATASACARSTRPSTPAPRSSRRAPRTTTPRTSPTPRPRPRSWRRPTGPR